MTDGMLDKRQWMPHKIEDSEEYGVVWNGGLQS